MAAIKRHKYYADYWGTFVFIICATVFCGQKKYMETSMWLQVMVALRWTFFSLEILQDDCIEVQTLTSCCSLVIKVMFPSRRSQGQIPKWVVSDL